MEQGSPEHIVQIIERIFNGPQVNTSGIRWLFNETSAELLISIQALAKRIWPTDFQSGPVSAYMRQRRRLNYKTVHGNLKKAKRLLLQNGKLAELTNEDGFYVKHVVTSSEEAAKYIPGARPGATTAATFGIVVTDAQDGARFVARAKRQLLVDEGLQKHIIRDTLIVANHGLLSEGRRLELSSCVPTCAQLNGNLLHTLKALSDPNAPLPALPEADEPVGLLTASEQEYVEEPAA